MALSTGAGSLEVSDRLDCCSPRLSIPRLCRMGHWVGVVEWGSASHGRHLWPGDGQHGLGAIRDEIILDCLQRPVSGSPR
jgi:hypothetical protein